MVGRLYSLRTRFPAGPAGRKAGCGQDCPPYVSPLKLVEFRPPHTTVRYRHPARRGYRNAPERSARGDVKCFPVRPAKGAVGHLVDRYGVKIEQPALGRKDIHATLKFGGGFVGRVRLVEASGHVKPSLAVGLHAVRTAAIAPVENQLPA